MCLSPTFSFHVKVLIFIGLRSRRAIGSPTLVATLVEKDQKSEGKDKHMMLHEEAANSYILCYNLKGMS